MPLTFLPNPPFNRLTARHIALDVAVIADHLRALAEVGRTAAIAASPADARHHLAAVQANLHVFEGLRFTSEPGEAIAAAAGLEMEAANG